MDISNFLLFAIYFNIFIYFFILPFLFYDMSHKSPQAERIEATLYLGQVKFWDRDFTQIKRYFYSLSLWWFVFTGNKRHYNIITSRWELQWSQVVIWAWSRSKNLTVKCPLTQRNFWDSNCSYLCCTRDLSQYWWYDLYGTICHTSGVLWTHQDKTIKISNFSFVKGPHPF